MTRIDDSQHDYPAGHILSDGGAAMMRAVIATAFGDADVLELRDAWPVPRPGAGQVAIAVRAAGVNFAEVMSRRVGYLGSRRRSSRALRSRERSAPSATGWTASPSAIACAR